MLALQAHLCGSVGLYPNLRTLELNDPKKGVMDSLELQAVAQALRCRQPHAEVQHQHVKWPQPLDDDDLADWELIHDMFM